MNQLRQLPVITALTAILLLTSCGTPTPPAPPEESPASSSTPTPSPKADPIVDSGPIEGAMGPVEMDADGVLRYTAVEGDVGGLVCERFGRAYWQLESNLTSGGFSCNSVIYLGEILTPTNDEKP